MDDLIKDFLVESYENLDRLDQDFVALETEPGSPEKMGSIFRTIHTIKGTCGCLGLPKLEATAHVGENLLSRLRDGQLQMDGPITTALLRLVDAIREILGTIERTDGSEGDGDYSAVCNELVRLNARPSVGGTAAPAGDAHHAAAPPAADPVPPAVVSPPVAVAAPAEVFPIPPELEAEFAVELAAERAAAAAAATEVHAPGAPLADLHAADVPRSRRPRSRRPRDGRPRGGCPRRRRPRPSRRSPGHGQGGEGTRRRIAGQQRRPR